MGANQSITRHEAPKGVFLYCFTPSYTIPITDQLKPQNSRRLSYTIISYSSIVFLFLILLQCRTIITP